MPESQTVEEPTKNSKVLTVIFVILASLVVLVLAAFFGGAYYFSSHFLPNTTVNGSDVSLMSVDELKEQIDNRSKGFAISVKGDGLDTSIKGEDFNLVSDGTSYSQQAINLVPYWFWPMEFNREHSYQVDEGLSYDSDKLSEIVTGLVEPINAAGTPTTDATLIYDEQNKTYKIQPEALGTQIDPKLTTKVIDEAAAGLIDEVSLDNNQLYQPNVFSDDSRLTTSAERANDMMSQPISLTIDGKEVATIDPAILQQGIRIEDGGFTVTFNGGKLAEWAQNDLSKVLDTVGTPRNFARPDGKQITVSGGTYGWVIDGFQMAATVTNILNSGMHSAVELPTKSRGTTWQPGGREWGRYIDCDLGEQYARFYDETGTVIWESAIVSGNTTTGHGTPEGVWVINAKMTNQLLIGLDENHDGQPDYKTPVDYWMPFVDNLVAFHDASWRGSFGGSIYSYDGSHGCVNLPYGKAVELFGICNEGDVVVSHW
ncbi:MAG: peptidoglycan binding domain-containing protein [Atopobiaceae bacterium]|nr:peptidoglycan binding domain-containing protein [Atopobiaceae bacterium]